jgi:hypothetical protein
LASVVAKIRINNLKAKQQENKVNTTKNTTGGEGNAQ